MTIEPLSTPDTDSCQECGRKNVVWFTNNTLWNLVMGGPEAKDDPGGFLCPTCFIERAEAAGTVPTAWVLEPETRAKVIPHDWAFARGATLDMDPPIRPVVCRRCGETGTRQDWPSGVVYSNTEPCRAERTATE